MENLQLGNYYTNSTGAKLTNSSGISFLAKASGLVGLLVMKEGHLSNLDDARQNSVFR